MCDQDSSSIIESCAVISAHIAKITDKLGNAELTTDEIRALRQCELQMSKLDATAWAMLCQLTTSDSLLDEIEESVRYTDQAIDALHSNPVTIKSSKRPYADDFGFGISGQHLG